MRDQDRIREHMEVIGADGRHVGTVDHLEAGGSIKLARSDPDSGGQHHWIPGDWVSDVEGGRVRLSMPRDEVQRQWRDRE
jgi:hypothetical protein